MQQTADAGRDASPTLDSGAVDAAALDAGIPKSGHFVGGRCTHPVLPCSRRDEGCASYEPLTECGGPYFLPVREGFCWGLRLRISFNGGGEWITYWDEETGELVAQDVGSDVLDYCEGQSARIVWGDLERVEFCEQTRGPQEIICSYDDDAGVVYSGL